MYIRPLNVKEALQAMKRRGSRVNVIAGGTNVIPDMRAKDIQRQSSGVGLVWGFVAQGR